VTTARHPSRRGRRRLELRPAELTVRLDPRRLRFRSTADVEPLVGTIGQPRALDALAIGLESRTRGFNVFVAGAPGSGRLTTVLDELGERSRRRPRPPDWVIVHNFHDPDRPNAISLPAGRGSELAEAMRDFVDTARRELRRAFESEEYERRQREIAGEVASRRSALEKELTAFAAERQVAVQTTPVGVVAIPLYEGEPLNRERFEQLPAGERERIAVASREVEARTVEFAHQLHALEKDAAAKIQRLERDVALFATGPLFAELEQRFAGEDEVVAYIGDVRDDLLGRLDEFRADEDELPAQLPFRPPRREPARYEVNTLVDNAGLEGAPVVLERNPSYYNLVGRIEYRGVFGAMVTDFREIKPGALHRANGGFLVLEILDVIRHPFAWDALKRALRAGEVRIENLAEEFSPVPSATLRPEPVPLDTKVVLVGSPFVYHVLFQLDDDFRELFKVKAEFSPELDWGAEHHRNYAAFISRQVRENGLRHFDTGAVARVVEHGARLRGNKRKLSARMLEIADLVAEASFWAEHLGHDLVTADDVELAIRKRRYRSNLLEERVQELINEGTLVIETSGERVGLVNGLSVLDLGDYAFGRPTRVSARVAVGRGSVHSIEREIELSGPIHSKGFEIVTGYLLGTYAQEAPLPLTATITLEQSYEEVEGDSASSTELYALLSALSGLPIDQGIAVTGAVDQHGEVRAIGGVNEKIEGFFASCKAQGLTGSQGVIVPAANVGHLVLDQEVVDAVAAGRFHVWAVRTVDEGVEILTRRPAGRRRADGSWPPGSVHGLAAARLQEYADRLRAASGEPKGDETG
jgi:lon-related putative ATP-dependent protease